MKTEIFLIRHGQPVLQHALLGSTDSALSELGWLQLENTVKNLSDIDLVISSSLLRCARFAQSYAENNLLPILIENQWQECNFGDWDGITYEALQNDHAEALSLFFKDPYQHNPPKGEAMRDFNQRIDLALKQLLVDHKGKRIALFCHAGVIRTLVGWCLKMDLTSGIQFKYFAIDYASITHLSVYHGEFEYSTNDKDTENLFPQLIKLNHV